MLSDIAHAVPLTLIAGSGYWTLGVVDWSMLASLLVGSIPGIIAGSASAPRIPDRVLRPILAVVLALVGAKLGARAAILILAGSAAFVRVRLIESGWMWTVSNW